MKAETTQENAENENEPRSDSAHTEQLIMSVANGDRNALAELYRLTSKNVYSFALSILKNEHQAADALQDCFVRIFTSAGEYAAKGKPLAWILTITRNLCMSQIRAAKRCGTLSDEEWSAVPQGGEFESAIDDRAMLELCMSALSDEEREIVVLHAVSGLKHREIAEILQIPQGTVLSKYNRAIKKLRAKLNDIP